MKTTGQETVPLKYFALLLPFMAVSSYLMFDIPYFIHDTFQCCQCPCPGDQGRLFTNTTQRLELGTFAMLNWWAVIIFMVYYFRKHPEALDTKTKVSTEEPEGKK